MLSKSVGIGEHVFQVNYKNTYLREMWYRTFPSLAKPSGQKSMNHQMHIDLEEGYGIPFLDYDVKITEEPNNITFKRADYLIETDPDYRNATIKFHDELALKHAFMNLYSSFIVHHKWGLLIHSSCVVENGVAHIFSGNSGAGKSTAAKLSLPRDLLSDEATIVKVAENKITVFDSPFRSELEADWVKQNAPLQSIQLLHQAVVNERIPIKKTVALVQLIDKIFYWSFKKAETDNVIQLLKVLVEEIPVYQLHFRKDNTFWELISNEGIYT